MISTGILSLNTGLALVAGIALLAILIGARKVLTRLLALVATKAGRSPFEAKPVMNATERSLYLRLLKAAPAGTLVLAQVQLSAFMQVRGLSDRQERWKYLNRIIRLSVDFLVVDASTMAPLIGIELDGASHRGGKSFTSGQMDADTRKSQSMASSGVALLRVPVKNALTVEQLRDILMVDIARNRPR